MDITNISNVLDFILFADDNSFSCSDSDLMSKFEVELQEVSNWFEGNKLSVMLARLVICCLEQM